MIASGDTLMGTLPDLVDESTHVPAKVHQHGSLPSVLAYKLCPVLLGCRGGTKLSPPPVKTAPLCSGAKRGMGRTLERLLREVGKNNWPGSGPAPLIPEYHQDMAGCGQRYPEAQGQLVFIFAWRC